MVKFLGSPLEVPAATASTQAVRKTYVDTGDAALSARIATLESGSATTTTGGQTLAVKSATGATTAAAGDFVLADATGAAFTVTLPASPTTNTAVAVKKVDSSSNLVTVVGAGTSKIDGDANLTLLQAQSGAVMVYDGANWRVESTVIFDPGAKNFTYRGAWSSTVTYGVNDVVFANGNAYVAILGSTNTAPVVDASSPTWGLLVLHGTNGAVGPTGATGPTGPSGPSGAVGANGPKGDTGAQGLIGPIGPTGPAGADGAAGLTGPTGPTGATGAAGANGATGPAGPTGPTGATGPAGTGFTYRGNWVSGTTYQIYDVIYYQGSTFLTVASTSTTSAPDPAYTTPFTLFAQGIRNRGAYVAGTSYVPGDVVAYSNGSYVNLAASTGTAPTVGSSTTTWMLLAAQGATGPTGPAGTNGSAGATGPTGPAGPTGPSGAAGTAATITVGSTTTGTPASVNNSGTSSAAVLDFTVPQGPTGPTGLTGPAGPTGPTGATGTVANSFVGAYSTTTAYTAGQLVTYNGTTYMAMQNMAANFSVPVQENNSPWMPFANGIKWYGAWDTTVTYHGGDAVSYLGSSYIATGRNTSGTLPTAVGANWTILAAQGAAGPTGPTGATGPAGPTGPAGTASGGSPVLFPWTSGRSFVAPNTNLVTTYNGFNATTSGWFCVRIPNACTVNNISLYYGGQAVNNVTVAIGIYSDVPTAASGGPATRLAYGFATVPTAAGMVTFGNAKYTFDAATNVWLAYSTTSGSMPVYSVANPIGNMLPSGPAGFSIGNGVFLTMKTSTGWNAATSTVPPADVSTLAFTQNSLNQPAFIFNIA